MKKNKYLDIFNFLLEIENKLAIGKKDLDYFYQTIKHVNSKDPSIRNMVASILSYFDNKESEEILVQLTKDRKWDVRVEAFLSLQYIGKTETLIDYLFDLLKHEKSLLCKSYLIATIPEIVFNSKIDSSNIIKKLYILKDKYKNEFETYHTIIYSLIILNEKHLLQELLQSLSSENIYKKYSALCKLEWLLEHHAFNDEQLRIETIEMIKKTKRVNKKRFPYINYKIDSILNPNQNIEKHNSK